MLGATLFGISIFILLIYLGIGVLIGWLAGLIVKGEGFGCLGNVVVAIFGSFLGGILFRLIGMTPRSSFGQFVSAVVGAVLLIYIIRLISKN